jgi:metal-dependent HD superfamily phosphatase/phosphodiesterase
MARITVERPDLVMDAHGVETRLSRDYAELGEQAMGRLRDLLAPHPKATRVLDLLDADPEVRADWDMADYLVVSKLGYNDHGEVHHKVVGAAAASLLQLLIEADVPTDVVASGAGDVDDAFMATVTACLLHDIGNQVHREGHDQMGVVLSLGILERLLTDVYPDAEQRYELRAFILHAIRSHDATLAPLTLEASVVSVADACDMTKGRSRYALDMGAISIHTVGGVSIERVSIEKGRARPVLIRVELSNSAGIFPVEEYVVPKVNAGVLAGHTEVVVTTQPVDSQSDRRVLYTVEMQGKRFVAVGPLQPPGETTPKATADVQVDVPEG